MDEPKRCNSRCKPEVEFEGRAGRSIGGASRRSGGRMSRRCNADWIARSQRMKRQGPFGFLAFSFVGCSLADGGLAGAAAEGSVVAGGGALGLGGGISAGGLGAGGHPTAGAHCAFEEVRDVYVGVYLRKVQTEAGWGDL